MAKKILKCALLGCGYIADRHIQAFQDCENTEIVALCGRNPERLKSLQEKYGIEKGYTDYHKLMEENPDLDMISNALPNSMHVSVTIELLEAGYNVLLEKPMAVNAEEGRALVEAEKKAKGKLMIIQNQRFIPAAQYMRRMFKEGEFGEVYHIRTGWRRPLGMTPSGMDNIGGVMSDRSWYNSKAANGGVLRDLGVHLLDLAMFITDFPEIESVSAASYRKFTASGPVDPEAAKDMSEDMCTALLKFKNGMSINMEVSFGTMISEEKLFTNIYGTRAGVERTGDELKLILHDPDYAYKVAYANLKGEKEFKNCIHEFADCLVNDKPVPVRAEQALKVIEILDMIYKETDDR
ncbi:MAG: Gfo/Idh/MocA family oxidoreductase [Clostridia bacterium]|nr:Gfo/Idh/MocA family oxidoreductase [Clostridia bacterium]